MLKIFYDGSIFFRQKYGGISNVYREIIKRFENEAGFGCAVTLPYNNKCDELKGVTKYLIPKFRPNRLYPYFWKLANEYYLNKFNPDIYHSTYYTEPVVNRRVKKVLTIHDMIHENHCEDFDSKACVKFVKLKERLANEADSIICVSKSTKRDVLKYYKINSSQVNVIYNSIDEIYTYKIAESEKHRFVHRYNLLKPYILYVGRIVEKYKNIDLLLEAYSSSNQINSTHDLIIISPNPYSYKQAEKISMLDNKVKKYSNITTEELRMFYNCADVFVYPSKYEGFGLPVLEAMACGTPVLASDTSSIPEVGGNSALYFNPNSTKDLIANILKIISDNKLKAELINRGYENIKRFSWEKSVRKLLQIYSGLF